MINYWWLTRPKRRLNSIPEILALISEEYISKEWEGQRNIQLEFENALEEKGLKKKGDRRDQRAGGARTYMAWLESLGLIFKQESTHKTYLTLAGESILNGKSPVVILKNQIFKYQFPSAFSTLSKNSMVDSRFKIRPFRFIFKLLLDEKIGYLTEEEIAKILIVEAENESSKCYNYIVNRLLDFRQFGDSCLDKSFFEKYRSSRSKKIASFDKYLDIANTIKCWMEYTQLIKIEEGRISIQEEQIDEVKAKLNEKTPLIDRWDDYEYFQRKYGVDPYHKKDTRKLNENHPITKEMVDEIKIKKHFISLALESPIFKITPDLIHTISLASGIEEGKVESILLKNYPCGSLNLFLTNYYDMAFKGRNNAIDFEKNTVRIFEEIFNFQAYHTGPHGRTPDVEIISHSENFTGIIDNKAYSSYSISNDHHNRMVHNYIETYKQKQPPLAFFLYIAGGFGKNIDLQIKKIYQETGIPGAAISINNFITLIGNYTTFGYNHKTLLKLFTKNREIHLIDF